MVRRLALCLAPAMALALAGCSGNGSGSSGSGGSTGQGTNTSTTSSSTGAGSTTGPGGTTGVNAATTSSSGSNGTTGQAGSTGSTGSTATSAGTVEVCDPCQTNADCASGFCDTAAHQCQVNDCTNTQADNDACVNSSSFNSFGACSDSTPTRCDCFALTEICGECFEDNDCVTGHCDPNQNDGSGACVTATCAGGSDADSQACTTAGGTCQGGTCACPAPLRDVCDGCSQDSDCASGHCVGATANTLGQCQVTDCLADGGEAGTEQACLNSSSAEAQFECSADGSCNCLPLGALCDPDGICFEDFDCAGGRCDQDNFVCTAACTSDNECAAASGATCDADAGACACPPPPAELCEDCTSIPCASGLTCDTNSHLCQTTTCYADGGGSSDDCFFASSSGTCNPDGSCICD